MAEVDRLQLTLDEETYERVLKGIDPAAEKNNRRWAALMITDASILLELPRATCATAQVLLHRYHCRMSMTGHDPLVILSMTCVFLATKIEETRRKIRDIMSVFHKLLNSYYGLPDSSLDINSNHYARWRSAILSSEPTLLSTLGFMVYTSHPHKFMLSYIQRLNGARDLAQVSWNFINDFQCMVDCLRYSPEAIASASIMFAARMLRLPLPNSPPWYELFGSTKSELLHICNLMSGMYDERPIAYTPLNDADAAVLKEIETDHRLLIESEEERLEAEALAALDGPAEREIPGDGVHNRSRSRSRDHDRRQRQSRTRSRSRGRSSRYPENFSWKGHRSPYRGQTRRRSRSRNRSRSCDRSYQAKRGDDQRYERRHSSRQRHR